LKKNLHHQEQLSRSPRRDRRSQRFLEKNRRDPIELNPAANRIGQVSGITRKPKIVRNFRAGSDGLENSHAMARAAPASSYRRGDMGLAHARIGPHHE
jgi:hypothetical protein